MGKPYESYRELTDDLLLLYGQVAGQAGAGQPVDGAMLLETLGSIIEKAHVTPRGHRENVQRAREAQQAATRPMERPDLRRGLKAVK